MIDKKRFLDVTGRPLTQGIFLEHQYDTNYAIYTLKDDDYFYEGKLYPSLKKLYLAEEDPTEYIFVEKHLLNWNQWKRLVANKKTKEFIDEWRDELELKLRAYAVREMQALINSENGSFQAAKYMADRGWDKRAAGRPSKAEKEKSLAIERHIEDDFKADVARMEDFRKTQ
jgi:hypothetical protein